MSAAKRKPKPEPAHPALAVVPPKPRRWLITKLDVFAEHEYVRIVNAVDEQGALAQVADLIDSGAEVRATSIYRLGLAEKAALIARDHSLALIINWIRNGGERMPRTWMICRFLPQGQYEFVARVEADDMLSAFAQVEQKIPAGGGEFRIATDITNAELVLWHTREYPPQQGLGLEAAIAKALASPTGLRRWLITQRDLQIHRGIFAITSASASDALEAARQAVGPGPAGSERIATDITEPWAAIAAAEIGGEPGLVDAIRRVTGRGLK